MHCITSMLLQLKIKVWTLAIYSAALQTLVLMFIVLHINGHFSLLLVNTFLSLVAYDNLPI